VQSNHTRIQGRQRRSPQIPNTPSDFKYFGAIFCSRRTHANTSSSASRTSNIFRLQWQKNARQNARKLARKLAYCLALVTKSGVVPQREKKSKQLDLRACHTFE